MKLSTALLCLSAPLALSARVKAEVKHTGNGNGYTDGQFPNGKTQAYIDARAKADSLIDWDGAYCLPPITKKEVYDQFGCCFGVETVNPFLAGGYKTAFVQPNHHQCFDTTNEGGLNTRIQFTPADTKPETDTYLFYMTKWGAKTLSRDNTFVIAEPNCIAAVTNSWDVENFLDERFKGDDNWIMHLAPVKEGPLEIGPSSAITNQGDVEETGGIWISTDCEALAERIRQGKVKYPPRNAWALAALQGKVKTGKGKPGRR